MRCLSTVFARRFGFRVLTILLTSGLVFAQATAELNGRVTDESGVLLWGNPVTNFASGTFARILSQNGDPRILQFGIKYAF